MTSIAFDNALKSGNPRVGIFFRLGLDPDPFRMWLGIGDCEAGIDAEDGDGEIYTGAGELLNVPAFQQLINGVAERVQFSLSGVSQRVAQMASSESDDVKGVFLNIGLGVFDENWQMIDSPVWLRKWTVDYLSIARDQQTNADAVYTVSLSARSLFTNRKRPALAFFTDEDQQRRSSGDKFCENTLRYSQGEVKAWPRP
jgi:hypothetical protein